MSPRITRLQLNSFRNYTALDLAMEVLAVSINGQKIRKAVDEALQTLSAYEETSDKEETPTVAIEESEGTMSDDCSTCYSELEEEDY